MAAVPSVTILVPSYKEDPAVVEKTLLSAALQDYPRRSVVLLIDDPPVATTYEDARSLDRMRQLADAVERRLAAMQPRISAVVTAFEARADTAPLQLACEARELAGLYREIGAWFTQEASRHEIVDHTDQVFVDLTLIDESRRYQTRAADLLRSVEMDMIDSGRLRCAYRQLASRFDVTVRAFERKRY